MNQIIEYIVVDGLKSVVDIVLQIVMCDKHTGDIWYNKMRKLKRWLLLQRT